MQKMLFIVVIFIGGLNLGQAEENLQFHYNEGNSAYQAGNYQDFLRHMQKANELRPNHPTLTYNLAAAFALNNQNDNAFKIMREVILMNSKTSFKEDADFAALIGTKRFKELEQLVNELEQPIANSKTIKSINLGTLHPEGIAFDGNSGDYFIGGVHDRRLVKISANDEFQEVLSYRDDKNVFSVMGVAIDENRGVIWLCTAALPEMVAYEDSLKGQSSVIAINRSGQILKSELLKGKHVFGDLKLKHDGSVLISDTGENKIYTTSMTSDLELFADLSEKSWNLQGITLNDDQSFLYYADYLSGIYRMSMTDKSVVKVDLGTAISTKGFDGIYYSENSILVIQNGVNPKKTWQLKLNEIGTTVQQAIVVDQALTVLNEPTQGVIQAGKFIYIANSPWSLYEKNQLQTDRLQDAVFLEYQL